MTAGELWRRICYVLNRGRIERELEQEMAAHRQMMKDPRGFGNVLKLREEARDAWGWGWLDRLSQDLRDGFRDLRRAPGFAITACMILSAGIGLNLTLFHLLNVTNLQPPAVADPHTLVRFNRAGQSFFSSGFPYPAAQFVRRHNEVLSAVLTRHRSDVVWDQDPANRLNASFVSANWFAQLGYGAAAGRVFAEHLDEKADAPPVVVVSHHLWRTRLNADSAIAGRWIRLNGRIATVIGVAPPHFPDLDLDNPQLWLLIHQIDYFEPGTGFKEDWKSHETELYARLRPGVSAAAVTEGLQGTIAGLAHARPQDFKADERLEPLMAADRFRGPRELREVLTVAALIGGLTLLVLVVASANLGNLVLSHAIGRLRELSIRAALGATRWRVLRHMLIESGLLAAAGAAGGIVLGHTSARLLASITEMPPYLDFTPDWRLFAAAFGVAFVAMLAFGLIPAWMVSRRDLIRAMKDGGEQTSAGLARARFRLALVGAQVIGCCALLVVAGSMARGLQRLLVADPGFTFDGVAIVDASLGRHGVSGDSAQAYWSEVAGIIGAHPDVDQLALAYPAPLGGTISQSSYGHDAGGVKISVMHVDPAAFSLLGIPLLAGRTFEPGDDRSLVIISRQLAILMYGTLDVLGKRFPQTHPTRTIIGVAGDAAVLDLRASNTAAEYRPLDRSQYQNAVLLARSRTEPQRLLEPLRAAARQPDPRVLPKTWLLAHEYEAKLRGPRLASTIAGLVAMLVLALACLGIFGVVAYAVRLRTKEIGIRRALGADAPRVVALLLRQLAWPVSLGMGIGTAAGLVASRLLGGEPFYLAITDATAPAAALIVFAIAAFAAAVAPASRAMLTDPVRALRHD